MQTLIRTTVLLSVGYLTAFAGEATTRWSWQEPQSKVLPTGDLEWAPQPFEFKAGESIRYIDFESGNDANDGLSKQTPWKHHPWDPNATGQAKACKGTHTYVFKQGVVYRGELDANESGTADGPIILTRDPSWGTGPAVICGSEAVTGWKQGADNTLIPEPEKVWYVDLDWAPRNVWMVGKDGAVTRIALARTPNWNITDPDDIKSEWWTWKNPDKPFDNYTTINGQRRHLAFDKEHINTNQPQDYYQGAIVWTTKGWVMGSPFPARVLAVDREKGSLTFAGQWGGEPSYKIIRGCQYYLEDKPQYLDSPGEFWFDKKGNGGRLYLRLPGDQDPNTARVEVAKRIRMIDSRGMSHVHVRGLTFRFANVYWNLIAAPYWVSHESIDVQPGCVRLLGSGTDIEVSHCTFEHVHKGVRLKAMGRQDAIDQVVVEDNVFSDADSGGVELADSTTYGDVAPPMGRLYDVRVMRNKFDHIGLRPDLFGQGGGAGGGLRPDGGSGGEHVRAGLRPGNRRARGQSRAARPPTAPSPAFSSTTTKRSIRCSTWTTSAASRPGRAARPTSMTTSRAIPAATATGITCSAPTPKTASATPITWTGRSRTTTSTTSPGANPRARRASWPTRRPSRRSSVTKTPSSTTPSSTS